MCVGVVGVMLQCTRGGQKTLVGVCPSTVGSMDLMQACLYLLGHLMGLRIKDYFHLKTKRGSEMAPIGSCFGHSDQSFWHYFEGAGAWQEEDLSRRWPLKAIPASGPCLCSLHPNSVLIQPRGLLIRFVFCK